jgi:phage minor structural protein
MYFITYRDDTHTETFLHDPRTTDRNLNEIKLTCETNSCGFCDFTIYPTHPLYSIIREHGHVVVKEEDSIIFSGFIYEIERTFYLDGHIKCKGDLAYLGMSVIKPCKQTFKSVGGYLKWLLNKHNSQVSLDKCIILGDVDEINVYIKIDRAQPFTSIESLSTDFLEVYTYGYVEVVFNGQYSVLNYKRDYKKTEKLIKFGENLTDYRITNSYENLATAIVATGYQVNESDSGDPIYLSLGRVPDGPTKYGSDICIKGNAMYSKWAVEKYGWIQRVYSNEEVDKIDVLMDEALNVLIDSYLPIQELEVKAIDMHMLNPELSPIRVGEYVHIISEPHGLDGYFACDAIDLDLNNPTNSIYTFGKATQTFTSTYKKEAKDAAKEVFDDEIDDYMEDTYENDQPTVTQTLKKIVVLSTSSNGKPSNVEFVYEKVTTPPPEPPEENTDAETGYDIPEDSGVDYPSDEEEEPPITEEIVEEVTESVNVSYDVNNHLIQYGDITIEWK